MPSSEQAKRFEAENSGAKAPVKGLFKRVADRIAGGEPPPSPPAPPPPSATAPPAPRADDFEAGRRLHTAGHLDEAGRVYRDVLREHPDHFDALHMLGVLCFQTGDRVQAVLLLRRAVAIRPADPQAHANLAATLRATDRLDEAEASLREVVRLAPGSGAAHGNLGSLLQARGDFAGAEAAFREAIRLDGDNAELLYGLGQTLAALRSNVDAEVCLTRVTELQPGAPEPHFQLGILAERAGRADVAAASYRRALALNPDFAEAHNNLGRVLQAEGELPAAEASYREAVRAAPGLAAALANLGEVLRLRGSPDEAERCCRQALAISPGRADLHCNLAAIYKTGRQLDQALAACATAIALDPSLAAAHNTRGTICLDSGDLEAAEQSFRRAIALDPASASAKYNLATIRLLLGDYREGFELYEHRFDCFRAEMASSRGLQGRIDAAKQWRGERLDGRRVWVWAEQGLGDSLMMMRYLPQLGTAGAAQVTVQCQPALERVMRSMPGVDEVTCRAEPPSATEFDVHVPMMSLPHLFRTDRDSVPGPVPYLVVPDAMRQEWQRRLAAAAGLKVGLAWAGSKALRDDARRSIPLRDFEALGRIGGVRLFSLQKDEEAAQLAGFAGPIENWMDRCDDLMDTAALVANLDLVISVDTAIVHLAGALGRPCWLLNRHGSEWRWGASGERSPWYPTLRVFRQNRDEPWGAVIARVAAELSLLKVSKGVS